MPIGGAALATTFRDNVIGESSREIGRKTFQILEESKKFLGQFLRRAD